jgi:hypothetical protein
VVFGHGHLGGVRRLFPFPALISVPYADVMLGYFLAR